MKSAEHGGSIAVEKSLQRTEAAVFADLAHLGVFATAASLFCMSVPCFADSETAADSLGLQEITVTAQRRAERLQDVPMSVAAVSQDQMDQLGLKNIDDLARETPSVTLIRNGFAGTFSDNQSNLSIRGVYSTAGAATTGIYIDDTPIQTRHLSYGSADPFPLLFDLDRVEVLRGPQGTLFGGGSEGGTVRFIRPEPSLTEYSGYSRAELASIDRGGVNYEGGAAFGGPIITDVLAFRVSAFYREDGGWVDRVNYSLVPTAGNPVPVATGTTESNSNWKDTYVVNAELKWAPTEGLTIEPAVYVQTQHVNDTGMYWVALSNPAANLYRNGNLNRDADTDPFTLVSLKVSWRLAFADFVSNTSYFNRHESAHTDGSQWLNTNYFSNPFPTADQYSAWFTEDNQNNLTEELRLSSNDPNARFTWTGGLFLTHNYENEPETYVDPTFAQLSGTTALPGNVIFYQPTFNTTDQQAALFGEVGAKITDSLRATVGVRVAHQTYSGTSYEIGPFVGPTINSYNSASENPVTPRAVLNYQPSPDSLYYASAAKGYRPGGLNTQLPPVCTAAYPIKVSPTFQSDSLWQYELGSKQTLLDHRLQVNGSVYYFKWNNIQQLTFLPCGLGFTPNLGEVTGRGGDIDATVRVTEDLTLSLQGAYTDAYFTNTQTLPTGATPVTIVTAGDHLPGSPWNLDVHTEYVLNSLPRKPYLRLDYQFATAQNSETQLYDPNDTGSDPTNRSLPEIRVLAARAGLRFDGFDISAFVQNALNYHTATYYYRDSQQPTDTNYFYRGITPRVVGVTATYRF